jgi:hypothetical protein
MAASSISVFIVFSEFGLSRLAAAPGKNCAYFVELFLIVVRR